MIKLNRHVMLEIFESRLIIREFSDTHRFLEEEIIVEITPSKVKELIEYLQPFAKEKIDE